VILDKVNSELAVRVVYASIGPEAVDQATLLAVQANATMVVLPSELLFGGGVLMQQIKLPNLLVKGIPLRVHVVGISFATFRASPEATTDLEVGALKTDGLVFVVSDQPGSEPALRAAYEHARSQPLGELYGAVIAPGGFDVAGVLGANVDVPVVSGHRAAMEALQAVMKPLLLDLAKQFG
jgi:hypothetical protein